MKYSQARPLLRSGDIVAFSGGSWKSWSDIQSSIVRIFTMSEYSHVGIVWVVGERVFVLEAVKPKLRIFPLSNYKEFYFISMDVPWSLETETYALKHIGEKYSQLKAIRAFFEPLEPGTVQQCAAYVREVLKKEGVYLGDTATPDKIILQALRRYNAEIVIVEKD